MVETAAMTGAREEVLDRVRSALGADVVVPEVPRAYGHDLTGDVVDLFCERVADYLATVTRVTLGELETALAERCGGRVIAAPGVEWPASARDTPDIPAAELDGYDAALTGCALAIAETGTIVLDGGAASGRRALTLVPDHHLCVVDASQIVASVPDAIAALAGAAREGRPITFVSGPSATSDIELERVEGVHGPRKLDVFVVTG
jgi:L-lactate dehydrogenase complex protein LldG